MRKRASSKGFTIVELLIVIVVIGILAAITLVAFNGIQNRAKASAAQSASSQASKKLQTYFLTNADTYPTDLATAGITDSGDTTFQYSVNNTTNPKTYCITTTTSNTSYYQNNTTQPSPISGGCPGHGVGGVAAITNYVYNPKLATSSSLWQASTPAGNTTGRNLGEGPAGEAVYVVTTTTAGVLRISFRTNAAGESFSITPGEQVNVSAYINSSQVVANAGFEVQFNTGWVAGNFGTINTGWGRYTAVITAPVGAATIFVTQLLTVSSVNAGSVFKTTNAQVTKGSTLYTYADGSSPNWVWNGTSNNSTSTGPPL